MTNYKFVLCIYLCSGIFYCPAWSDIGWSTSTAQSMGISGKLWFT